MSRSLDADLSRALRHWNRADPVLARLARTHGARPTPRPRDGGFASLVTSLLHQQVSIAAGRSITRRVTAACGGSLRAPVLVRMSVEELRACGVSRQKASYLLDLAQRTVDGRLNFRRLFRMSDQAVIEDLVQVRGIGTWTAKMFLLFHLRRPDVVAPEDLGLRIAVSKAYKVPMSRAAQTMERQAPLWSPYGSLASIVLWTCKDKA